MTKQENCDAIKVRAIYDDLVAKIRRDKSRLGDWLDSGGLGSSGAPVPASPLSGQTAPLNAAGFAGTVSSNIPSETQHFIGRIVIDLKGRVNNNSGLVQFANTWIHRAREKHCDPEMVKPVYDEMIAQLRRESQGLNAWIYLPQNEPNSFFNSGSLAGSLSSGTPESAVSGNAAVLTEKGLAGVCASGKPTDVEIFVGRLAVSMGFHVQSYPTLQQLAREWSAKVKSLNFEASKAKPVLDEIQNRLRNDAKTPGSWVKDPKSLAAPKPLGSSSSVQPLSPPSTGSAASSALDGSPATPQSGQEAALTAAGFAAAVAKGKPQDVEVFVGRLVYDLGCRTAPGKYSTLRDLASEWAGQVRQQQCIPNRVGSIYDSMVARIRQDSQTPGSWVQVSASKSASSSAASSSLSPPPLAPMAPIGSTAPLGQRPMAPMGQPPPMAPMTPAPMAPMTPAPLGPYGQRR
jgi:hypothetical protein